MASTGLRRVDHAFCLRLSPPSRRKPNLETGSDRAHSALMADSDEQPVMLPFQDQGGTGWHVIIRYHEGHERRIDGLATEEEAITC
jgi:hypothetical protein